MEAKNECSFAISLTKFLSAFWLVKSKCISGKQFWSSINLTFTWLVFKCDIFGMEFAQYWSRGFTAGDSCSCTVCWRPQGTTMSKLVTQKQTWTNHTEFMFYLKYFQTVCSSFTGEMTSWMRASYIVSPLTSDKEQHSRASLRFSMEVPVQRKSSPCSG